MTFPKPFVARLSTLFHCPSRPRVIAATPRATFAVSNITAPSAAEEKRRQKREAERAWYAKNRERVLEQKRERNKRYAANNPEKIRTGHRLRNFRARATRLGLEVEPTVAKWEQQWQEKAKTGPKAEILAKEKEWQEIHGSKGSRWEVERTRHENALAQKAAMSPQSAASPKAMPSTEGAHVYRVPAGIMQQLGFGRFNYS